MLLDNIGEITWNTHFADVYETTAIDTLSIVIRLYINFTARYPIEYRGYYNTADI
jgi:hypothetical protein